MLSWDAFLPCSCCHHSWMPPGPAMFLLGASCPTWVLGFSPSCSDDSTHCFLSRSCVGATGIIQSGRSASPDWIWSLAPVGSRIRCPGAWNSLLCVTPKAVVLPVVPNDSFCCCYHNLDSFMCWGSPFPVTYWGMLEVSVECLHCN